MRFPSPQIVTSATSGFVLGVLVTLLASGVLAHTDPTSTAPPQPTPKAVGVATLHDRIWRLANRALGPTTNGTQQRLVSVSLLRVHSLEAVADPVTNVDQYRSVNILFRLNDHPLGKSWRLKAAKADVFALMKTLYTSDLPVYDVEAIGLFPLHGKGGTEETQAMIAYETHDQAARIPWKNWGRENEGVLWNRLPYKAVDPRFG